MARTKCEVWSRSVGYLRPIEQWNEGKVQEFRERKTFDKQLKVQTYDNDSCEQEEQGSDGRHNKQEEPV